MSKACSIDDCERKASARTWCNKHYLRWHAHGDPLATVRAWSKNPLESFKSRTKDEGECLVWTGAHSSDGYGMIHAGEKKMLAHRWSYEQFVGPIPEGLAIDHACRNKTCVRPEHLRAVTNKQNAENLSGGHRDNATSARGVSWYPARNKYMVQIVHNYKKHYLGLFDSIEEASAVATTKRLELFTHNDADRVVN